MASSWQLQSTIGAVRLFAPRNSDKADESKMESGNATSNAGSHKLVTPREIGPYAVRRTSDSNGD